MQVGDKVLITDNLKKLMYKGYDIVNEMLEYAGETTTIKTVYDSEHNSKYNLDIDDGEYYWHAKLLITQSKEKQAKALLKELNRPINIEVKG